MINLISDILHNLFGDGETCYRCGRKLRQNTIEIIEEWIPFDYPLTHRGKTFSCPRKHVSCIYSPKTGKLINIIYIVGKFAIKINYYNARGLAFPVNGMVVSWEKNGDIEKLIIPYFNVEKYTPEQVKRKIKLYLVFS